ncbi:hypothetical protein BRADI_4g37561v3 [Brachypodium distachyon]|uniref:RNase H type-1 domain-containing protein n=1 Tax=Brachypodium distachyon TaxID=15368 RepID=A0A0Q3EY67_BRADI|nr:hypothetical protein BRADI_4g37561v3 [Brachypodium distachyon]
MWEDPWIPRSISRWPLTNKGHHIIEKVSELLDPINGGWDEGLVRQTFDPEDAEEILQIPVREEEEDLVAWHFDRRDGGHCFFKCKHVKQIWRSLQWEELRQKLASYINPRLALLENFKLEDKVCSKICILLWLWWAERNKVHLGGNIRGLKEILSSIEFHSKEFQDEWFLDKKAQVITSKGCWTPPPENFLKINTDDGELQAAGAGHLNNVFEAFQAEALAIIEAIYRANDMGCNRVIFETDAQALKQSLISDAYDNSKFGVLFKEAKTLLRLSFVDLRVQGCNRNYNSVAHALASFGAGLESSSQMHWLHDFPDFVTVKAVGDMPHR